MNPVKYNVLWFEDQCKDANLQEIADKAFDKYSIILNGYESAEEGLKVLDNDFEFIDAVLLDAQFHLKKDDVSGTEDLKGLRQVWNKIIQLEAKGIVIPKFILSGQTRYNNDETFIDTYGEFYSKLVPDDLNRLFSDIVKVANCRSETQIRHEYSEVFEVCVELKLSNEIQKTLLQILKSIKEPLKTFDDELYFNQIRIILESIFRAANRVGLLHDKCIPGGKVNLTESALFLSGEQTKHLEVKCKMSHFTKIISDNVKTMLHITGAASHTVDPNIKNNINLSEYRKLINTPYLLYSLTFQLMDILIWFKKYIDENPDKEVNINYWSTIKVHPTINDNEWIKGSIIRIAENGYGTIQPENDGKKISIIPSLVKENKFVEGETVYVKTKFDQTGMKIQIKELKR
jgi:hypothetical protein